MITIDEYRKLKADDRIPGISSDLSKSNLTFSISDYKKLKAEGKTPWNTDSLNKSIDEVRSYIGTVSDQSQFKGNQWTDDEYNNNRAQAAGMRNRLRALEVYANSIKDKDEGAYRNAMSAYSQLSGALDQVDDWFKSNEGDAFKSNWENYRQADKAQKLNKGIDQMRAGSTAKEQAAALGLDEKELETAYKEQRDYEKQEDLVNRFGGMSYDELLGVINDPKRNAQRIVGEVDQYYKNLHNWENESEQDMELALKTAAERNNLSVEQVREIYNGGKEMHNRATYASDALSNDDSNYIFSRIIESGSAEQLQQLKKDLPSGKYYDKLRNSINLAIEEKKEQRYFLDVKEKFPEIDKLIETKENGDEFYRQGFNEEQDPEGFKEYDKANKLLSVYEKMGVDVDKYKQYKENYKNRLVNDMFQTAVSVAADKHPVLTSLASTPVNMIGSLGDVPKVIRAAFDDDYYYDPKGTASYTAQNIRGTVSKKIDNPGWEFLYNTGASMSDSAIGIAANYIPVVGQFVSSAMFFSSAGVSAANEVVENGGTPAQAAWTMLAHGGAELVFEEISLEKLNALQAAKNVKGAKQIITNILKQSFTESSEEVATTLANTLTDQMINGDLSAFARSKQAYIDEGLSEKEATAKAVTDWWASLGMDAAGGAFSGGVFGALGSTKAHLSYRSAMKNTTVTLGGVEMSAKDALKAAPDHFHDLAQKLTENEGFDVKQLTEIAKDASEDGKARTLADSMERTIRESGKEKITAADVENLLTELYKENIDAHTTGEHAKSAAAWNAIDKLTGDQENELNDSDKAILDKVKNGAVLSEDERQAVDNSPNLARKIAGVIKADPEKIKSVDFDEKRSNQDKFKASDNGKTFVNDKEFTGGIEIASVDPRTGTITYDLNYADGTSEQLTSDKIRFPTSEEAQLHERAASYNTDQARAFVENYHEGQDVDNYAREWNLYSNYGRLAVNLNLDNRMENGATLTNEQKLEAYQQGLNSRIAHNQAQTIVESVNGLKPYTSQTQGTFAYNVPSSVKLTKAQMQMKSFFRDMSAVTGLNIEIFQSKTDAHGNYIGENGSYDPSTNTLRVDINAGLNHEGQKEAYQYSMLNTVAHELTHVAKQGGKYENLREAVIAALGTTKTKFNELVEKKYDELRKNEKYAKLSDEKLMELADEEVICDACETMLQGNSKFFENLYKKDRGLAKKLVEAIKNLVEKIKSFVADRKHANTEYGKALLKVADDLYNQVQQLWNEAVESGLEASNAQKAEKNKIKYSDRITQSDTDYLSAVERGDMETAQRMVDEAAERAFINSKVRDKDGKPLVVYHQTGADFTVFDTESKGAGRYDDETPNGIFLKPTDTDIGLKGKKQMALYASIKNPLTVRNREELVKFYEQNIDGYEEKKVALKHIDIEYGAKYEEASKRADEEYAVMHRKLRKKEITREEYDNFAKKEGEEARVIKEWEQAGNKASAELKALVTRYFKNSEYDGIIIEQDAGSFGRSTKTFIALEQTQIKSADPVTYDDGGNVIPLSQRFNTENNDIRYQDRDYSVEPENYGDLFEDLFTDDGDLSFGEEADTRRAESIIDKMIEYDAENAAYFLSYSAGEIAQNTLNGLKDIELSDSSYLKIAKRFYKESTIRMNINSEEIAEQVKLFVGLYDDGMFDSFDAFLSQIVRWNEQNVRSDKFASPENMLTNAYNLISLIAEEKASYANNVGEMSEKYAKMERASTKAKAEVKQLKAENQELNRSLSGQEDLTDYYRKETYNSRKEISNLQMLNRQLEKAMAKAEEQAERRIERTVERYNKKLDKQKLKASEQKAAALDRMRERYEKLLTAEKAKAKDQRRADHDKVVERYEKKITELKEKAKQQKRDIREDRDTKLIAAKDKRQADLKALRNNRDKKEYVRKIKKVASELQQWALHPTDKHFVPQEFLRSGFYQAVNDITEALIISDNTQIADKLRKIAAGVMKLQGEAEFKYDIDPVIAAEMNDLADAIGDKKINRDLTLRQAEDIYRALRTIKDSVVNARKLIFEGETKDVVEAGVEIINEQKQINPALFNRSLNNVKKFFLTPERVHNIINGYNEGSTLDRVFQGVKQGIRKKNNFFMDANKMFDAYRDAHVKELDQTQHKVRDIKWTDNAGHKRTTKMTGMQAMQLVMTWNREAADSRLAHMKKGGVSILGAEALAKGNFKKAYENRETVLGINESFITNVQNSLTEFERGYIDIAEQFFNGMAKDAINEVSMILRHFETATSEYYIPIKVDDAEIVKEIEGVKQDSSIENMGMLKSVVPYSDKSVLIQGLDNVINKHIDNVGNYYGLAIPIRNMNKVLNVSDTVRDSDGSVVSRNSVKKSLEKNWGKLGTDIYEQLLIDLQNSRAPSNERMQGINNLVRKIRSNFVTATLNGNISVTIKQAASYSTAGVYLDQTSLMKGSADMIKFLKPGNLQALFDEIDSHTAQHYIRRKGLSSNEIADIQQSWLKTSKLGRNINNSKLMQKMPAGVNPTNWIQEMDCMTTAALWCATKEQVNKQYKKAGKQIDTDEYWQDVTNLYDKVIEDTQPMYDAMHRPEILKSSSELIKSVFMFKTQPLQNAGIIYDAVGRVMQDKKDKAAWKQLRKGIMSQGKSLLVFAGMSLFAAFVLHRMDRYRDEDDEATAQSIWDTFIKDVIQNGAGVVLPFGGNEGAGAIINTIDTGKLDFSSVMKDNVAETVTGFFGAGADLVNTINEQLGSDDPDTNKIAAAAEKFTITWVSDIFGVPVKNAKNIIKGGVDWAEDIADGGEKFKPDVSNMKAKQIIHSYQKHFENGETDTANSRIQDFYDLKLQSAKDKGKDDPEKEARNAVRDAFTDYYKKIYQKAFRENNTAELERIRKILVSQSKYMVWGAKNTPLSEKLREWQKEASKEK